MCSREPRPGTPHPVCPGNRVRATYVCTRNQVPVPSRVHQKLHPCAPLCAPRNYHRAPLCTHGNHVWSPRCAHRKPRRCAPLCAPEPCWCTALCAPETTSGHLPCNPPLTRSTSVGPPLCSQELRPGTPLCAPETTSGYTQTHTHTHIPRGHGNHKFALVRPPPLVCYSLGSENPVFRFSVPAPRTKF